MKNNATCHICGNGRPNVEIYATSALRVGVLNQVLKEYPHWQNEYYICSEHLHIYRSAYVRSLLEQEKGELHELEENVIQSLRNQELITSDFENTLAEQSTFGEHLSDKIATFGGSWTFIITFFLILISWILINTYLLTKEPFDPFPFILLNLILSCLAAIQAPIIMMSQNRQESRDRSRNINDYQINLKAELEIRQVHQKLDHIISHQWERLAEIQQVQIDLMNELKKPPPINPKK